MTSAPWIRPAAPEPVKGTFTRIVLPIGLVLTVGAGCLAWFVAAMMPLVCYGDRDIPEAFSRHFDHYFQESTGVAAAVVLVLLAASLVLGRLPRGSARVLGSVCLAVAIVAPWVWMVLSYSQARHWASLAP
ncbi:putative membrane protein YphA (DoxX/SURF4 family) [Streptacidiphilus sp. MAP12-33]|uniref:hypothetical protein n=1 Tax=Streptacidiphilus sp. MAP12-33 TaxID=3156266 RepID=UPI003512385F